MNYDRAVLGNIDSLAYEALQETCVVRIRQESGEGGGTRGTRDPTTSRRWRWREDTGRNPTEDR